MTDYGKGLHLGLADFAEPTLLILGQSASFVWLGAQIASRRDIVLERHLPKRQISLRFVPTAQNGRFFQQNQAFEWQVSEAEAKTVAGQLEGLARANLPANAYLDPDTNTTGVQVVASCGEYEPTKIFD